MRRATLANIYVFHNAKFYDVASLTDLLLALGHLRWRAFAVQCVRRLVVGGSFGSRCLVGRVGRDSRFLALGQHGRAKGEI